VSAKKVCFKGGSGPNSKLDLRAVTKGSVKPRCVEWQCVLDTGAGKGLIAPLVKRTLALPQTGTRTIHNAKIEKTLPEHRVSIWHGSVCLLPDYPVAELQPYGAPVLLGQDFLSWCLFSQDGPSKVVQLQF
jgi:hypothetical protein